MRCPIVLSQMTNSALSPSRTRSPILVVLILSGLGGLFAYLASGIVNGEKHAFDAALMLAMRNPTDLSDAIGPRWLEEMMRDFSGLGAVGVITLFVVLAAGFLWLRGERRSVVILLIAVALATITSLSLKAGFDRPRPDLVPHGSFVSNASFPSGHSLTAAAVYLTLGLLFARMSAQVGVRVFLVSIALLFVLLVGISRVYLGVHWPTDVLAGWSVGASIALICTAFAR